MMHIHPFPARMAPEIALKRLNNLSINDVVLDPMCGSGMVLGQSAKVGIQSIGCDLDPLARLISRVGSTRVRVSAVWDAYDQLANYCKRDNRFKIRLSWIDSDEETKEFISYWFGKKQENQLRRVAKYLNLHNTNFASNSLNVIAIALSRLIISKEPKASLARDTAHSRPHKTIVINDFDIYHNLEGSISHVLKALDPAAIVTNSMTYLSDARNLSYINNSSVDAIITSPPYLNAIDYMRGHKFSLVWLGYNLASLRAISKTTIGSESVSRSDVHNEVKELLSKIKLEGINSKTKWLLNMYYIDLKALLMECKRVLKRRRSALFVIGNSSISGDYVKNNEILKFAARKVGFKIEKETVRKIPDNRRYLPVNVSKSNSLAGRMRTEHIIDLVS